MQHWNSLVFTLKEEFASRKSHESSATLVRRNISTSTATTNDYEWPPKLYLGVVRVGVSGGGEGGEGEGGGRWGGGVGGVQNRSLIVMDDLGARCLNTP